MVVLLLVFQGNSTLISIVATLNYIPTKDAQGFLTPASLPFVAFSFLNILF
jgi:hypothetical protein